jgi:hypothetical protein
MLSTCARPENWLKRASSSTNDWCARPRESKFGDWRLFSVSQVLAALVFLYDKSVHKK